MNTNDFHTNYAEEFVTVRAASPCPREDEQSTMSSFLKISPHWTPEERLIVIQLICRRMQAAQDYRQLYAMAQTIEFLTCKTSSWLELNRTTIQDDAATIAPDVFRKSAGNKPHP